MKVVVIGQGYVGLPISARAVEVGLDVVGLDIDSARATRLRSGTSFVEDVSDEVLKSMLATGRFLPSADYGDAAGFDVAVITVPTPLREGAPDLSYIEDAARSIAPYVRRGCTVVLESTTYPGTTDELLIPLLQAGSGLVAGRDFHVGYSPERIDPGNTRYTFRTTPKVVSGIDPASLDRVADFYGLLVDQIVPVSSTRVAELTKLLENTFRHVNIALVNELAVFSRALGVSMWEALDAADSKPFGFMRFNPGPGVGGHCLPVDPSYLSWQVKRETGRTFRFVELANDVNDHMPDYVVSRVVEALNARKQAVNGSVVLVVGVSYKRNTADVRESPAIRLVRLLGDLGAAVRYADPYVTTFPGAVRVDLDEAAVAAADAVVVVTDHDAFDYDLLLAAPGVVLDTRNRLGGKRELL
jgi:nucleotide sugar dehydrogenase